jgi:ADP-ribose pyrophosphatase YjhB (NUDIX family)
MKKDMIIVNFRVAVKAFIVEGERLFAIKRVGDDVQSPNIWEIPGGRLELGEDPILGVMREIREETGMYIDVKYPMTIRHFERADGQIITMIVFLCKPRGGEMKISDEHSDFEWIDIENCEEKLTDFFHKEVQVYRRLRLSKLV